MHTKIILFLCVPERDHLGEDFSRVYNGENGTSLSMTSMVRVVVYRMEDELCLKGHSAIDSHCTMSLVAHSVTHIRETSSWFQERYADSLLMQVQRRALDRRLSHTTHPIPG